MCQTENEREIRRLNAELERAYALIDRLKDAVDKQLCPECELDEEYAAWENHVPIDSEDD